MPYFLNLKAYEIPFWISNIKAFCKSVSLLPTIQGLVLSGDKDYKFNFNFQNNHGFVCGVLICCNNFLLDCSSPQTLSPSRHPILLSCMEKTNTMAAYEMDPTFDFPSFNQRRYCHPIFFTIYFIFRILPIVPGVGVMVGATSVLIKKETRFG